MALKCIEGPDGSIYLTDAKTYWWKLDGISGKRVIGVPAASLVRQLRATANEIERIEALASGKTE